MKKNLVLILLCVATCVAAVACNKDEPSKVFTPAKGQKGQAGAGNLAQAQ